MHMYKRENYEDMSQKAADIIAAQIVLKPKSVLGFATGSTPIGAYQRLIEQHTLRGLDFSSITTFNLDEYVGLPASNNQSYRYFMEDELFSHVNIDPKSINFLDGMATDLKSEARRYEDRIKEVGGIDLQLLGMGHNGHIAFNEPSDHFKAETFVEKLTPRTIEANKRFFDNEEEVPRTALTMGIGTIMRARMILFIVSGEEKAEIVKKALRGPITPEVPASVLQLHNNVVFIGDEAAMSLL